MLYIFTLSALFSYYGLASLKQQKTWLPIASLLPFQKGADPLPLEASLKASNWNRLAGLCIKSHPLTNHCSLERSWELTGSSHFLVGGTWWGAGWVEEGRNSSPREGVWGSQENGGLLGGGNMSAEEWNKSQIICWRKGQTGFYA